MRAASSARPATSSDVPPSSPTSAGRSAIASRSVASMALERSSVPSMTRFSRFSTAQAKSPMRRAPTTRPLPFSVWKARRTRVSDSRSAGFSAHSGNRRPTVAISSPASSMKSARSSGSTAWRRSVASRTGAGGGGAAGGRHARRRARGVRAHGIERQQAAFGVVQHVPGVAAARLQRLHVVLDADDRIRQPVDVLVIARAGCPARAARRRDRRCGASLPSRGCDRAAAGPP